MNTDDKTQTAAIVFGPMGVGKSVISGKLVNETDLVYINPDLFWDRTSGEKYTKEISINNWSQADGKVVSSIRRGQSFLLDSSLMRRSDREEVTAIIRALNHNTPEYDFRIFGFYVKANLETCLLRNAAREESQQEEVIKKYHSYFETEQPSVLEGFDELQVIENSQGTLIKNLRMPYLNN